MQQVAPLQSQHDYAAPARSNVTNANTATSKTAAGPSSAAGLTFVVLGLFFSLLH